MRRFLLAFPLVLLGLALAAAQKPPNYGRSVHGVVLDAREQPVPGAIVYLTNLRSKAIRTFIADDKGAFAFHELEANVDYQLQAEHAGQRGPARTLSVYNTATDPQLDLKVP